MSDPDPDEVLRKCASILAEHYDAVQILVSKVSPENKTLSAAWGSGNYYARLGMAQNFISRNHADNIGEMVVKHQNE